MASREGVSGRGGPWRGIVLAVALAGLALPARAANTCPWMNEATASGLLGSEAVGSYTPAAAAQPAGCIFVESNQGITRTLTITVETNADAHARVGALLNASNAMPSALQAIGNEAEMCKAVWPHGVRGEVVGGRVRDQAFSIAISTTMKNDPVLNAEELENRIATAAEQVTGSLF
jgi:hypothetical protein